MRLSEFISDTLFEIALGVQKAQLRAKDMMAINPGSLDGEQLVEKSFIDFDVAVVVNETETGAKGASGKIGGQVKVASLFSANLELGSSGEKKKERASAETHRVTFKVPVYMNADFKNNPATAARAVEVLEAAEKQSAQ